MNEFLEISSELAADVVLAKARNDKKNNDLLGLCRFLFLLAIAALVYYYYS